MGSRDLRTNMKLYQKSFKTAKFKMHASIAMVTTFPYHQVIQIIVITRRHMFTKYEVCIPLNAKVIKVMF